MHATPAAGIVTGIDHYENFPVASVLVPKPLRPALLALYRFARHADDVADEGDASAQARLAELSRMEAALLAPRGAPPVEDHPVVAALRPHLDARGLSRADCLALLSAFRQDVTVDRYRDFDALRDYCRRSADPVGHLVLELFGCRDARTEPLADAICTALQLLNFLQDVASDWQRGRLYLPLDALAREGLDAAAVGDAVRAGRSPAALRRCIAGEARRAGALLESGAPLLRLVPRRLSWELRATLAGARRVLELLDAGGHDPVARRPRLRGRDAPALLRLMFRPPRLQ
jgi:phytoene synthase